MSLFWSDLTDVASSDIGGRVLFATDDWFARCEYLISPNPPIFDPNAFTPFGKLMDGWETRRKRQAGHDWCIIELAAPSRVYGFEVDTAFFTGNQTPRISVQAMSLVSGDVPALATMRSTFSGDFKGKEGGFAAEQSQLDAVGALSSDTWPELLPMSELKPGYPETRLHQFTSVIPSSGVVPVVTHLRINMFPDGGIARLRVRGEIVRELDQNVVVDVAAASNGGAALGSSNAHYGRASNLIAPGRSERMDQGWETARNPNRPPILTINKDTGMLDLPKEMAEWALIRLATPSVVHQIEVDTDHFKGNCPEAMELEFACMNVASSEVPRADELQIVSENAVWSPLLLKRTRLVPHSQHVFTVAEDHLASNVIATHVRLRMYPDGGIARLRVLSKPSSKTSGSKM
jgi:allantoicase